MSEFNFLGLTIDEHVSWNKHIQKTANKISRSIGIIKRLKRTLPLYVLCTLYNSLIFPYLNYGILNWGFVCNRLYKLQKKAIRVVSNSQYNAHTEPLFKILNMMKLEDIFKLNLLKLYYKFENNTLPSYHMNIFKKNQQNERYHLRNEHVLHHSTCNTKGGEHTIRYYLPREIEKTPMCILNKVFSHSFKGFSSYCKKFFIQKYITVCSLINCYICQNT